MAPSLTPDAQRSSVETYYGETLQSTADLKTSACCPIDAAPAAHQRILNQLHPEVLSRFYGCGSPIPDALSGVRLLDLGCGTGRDAYLAAALVGPAGSVIGVDMTQAQLDVAQRHIAFHADALLDGVVNVAFRKGVIEDLSSAGIADASVDVVISNCVCNLSPDKPAVFREAARVLADGGEFYFSDIYADRRLSADAAADEELVGECLGGALYIQDFRRVMAEAGLPDVRVVSAAPVVLDDERMLALALVPGVRFYSVTVRAFKVAGLEDRAEDFGQTATYTGCCGSGQIFDKRFHFPKDEALRVDGNTAEILVKSRYAKRFDVTPRGAHQGLFEAQVEAGVIASFIEPEAEAKSQAGCCPPKKESDAKESCCAPKASAKKSGGGCC